MTTYKTTDNPPVNCSVFGQSHIGDKPSPITASFPCGCVIEDIWPTLTKTWYRCGCGKYEFYVKAECVVWDQKQAEIEGVLTDVEYMLRNEHHIRPWVRRLKAIIDVALRRDSGTNVG